MAKKVDAPTAWDKSTELKSPTVNGFLLSNNSSNLVVPKSEAESASVNDLGEAKRLHRNEEEITQSSTSSAAIAQLVQRTGTQFTDSSSELENGDASRYRHPDLGSFNDDLAVNGGQKTTKSLASRLRAELKSSLAGQEGRKFLPRDKFDEILTRQAVRQELETVFGKENEGELTRLTDKVYKASMTEPDKPNTVTHRRKLFALLALMEMVPSIQKFIEAGIHDSDLPFIMEENTRSTTPFYCVYRWHDIRKSGNAENRSPISCFSTWPDHQIEGFERNQWQLLAPYFELGSLNPYNLQDNIILPFIEDTSDSLKESGFSDVWRVKIHPAHHNQGSSSNEADNPSYAVKRLRQNSREAFDKEVEALKRFSDKTHLHLISLLLTYKYRGKYHLVFPWADGNLRSFWTDEHPHYDFPPRDWNFVKWVARQWLAIALGLQAIHKTDRRHETRDPSDPRVHGRHGDLKPENILWFKSGHRHLKNYESGGLGILVISDFGLTSFHRNETKDQVSPSHLARSPTYRPPECDVSKTISQSYDVWSLGCILLEFAIWYIHGWSEVDEASSRRAQSEAQTGSEANFVEDKFFELTEKVVHVVDDDKIERVAKLKRCVDEDFKSLSQQGTTRFFHDLLEFVNKKLLRMRPDKRASCDDIVNKFHDMYEKCLNDEAYCTQIVPRPDRTATNNSELHSSYAVMATIPEASPDGTTHGGSPGDLEPDEAHTLGTNSMENDGTARNGFKDLDRQMSQSPTPLDNDCFDLKMARKSSLKQKPAENSSGIPDTTPPSPTKPGRTDSNGTEGSSPTKRVSFAGKTGVHYPDSSPEVSQHVDSSPDISQQPDLGVLVMNQFHVSAAEERPAPIHAREILLPGIKQTHPEQPLTDTRSQTLALPPQQTARSSLNTEHKGDESNPPPHERRALDESSAWELFVAFCKKLCCR